jgi:hypothetical protein
MATGHLLIHDPVVRHYCFEGISQLGNSWSARTFRDRSYTNLAIYYLRSIEMVLVHPKKRICKDGHEYADTVVYRKVYTSALAEFQQREMTYNGKDLQIEIPPKQIL